MNIANTQPRPAEGIRSWYKRKTRKAIVGLIGATVILIVAATLVWVFAPMAGIARAQTFNGALTIPGFGGLWIASFMFIWLIPMREVSFRGQESMERMEAKLIPAIETWQRVGDRFERVILPKLEEAIDTTQRTAQLIEKKAAPAIEIARRIEANIEAELTTGLLQEIRSAAQSVNLVVMSKEGTPTPPSVDRALEALNTAPKVTRGGRA